MPRRYRKKQHHKKKQLTRRHRRYKQPSYVFASGMPTTRLAKLRYVGQPVFNSSVGLIQTWKFSANGIFDPDITGTGHQPMGFDQWSAYYNHYTVVGARCTIRCMTTPSAGSYAPTLLALYLSDDTSQPFTGASGYLESKKGPFVAFGIEDTKQKFLSHNFSAKKFFNVSDMKDNFDRLGALAGANPTEQAYFTLVHAPVYPGQTTQPMNLIVTLDYVVQWSEPKDMEQS